MEVEAEAEAEAEVEVEMGERSSACGGGGCTESAEGGGAPEGDGDVEAAGEAAEVGRARPSEGPSGSWTAAGGRRDESRFGSSTAGKMADGGRMCSRRTPSSHSGFMSAAHLLCTCATHTAHKREAHVSTSMQQTNKQYNKVNLQQRALWCTRSGNVELGRALLQ